MAKREFSKQQSRGNQKEAESLYKSIFDAVREGIIINDLETGLVVEANPAAYIQHGYTREEFIGLPLTKLIHPDSQQAFREYVQGLQADDVTNARMLHVRQDNPTFYAEWSVTNFTFQGQSCLLCIFRDVSQQTQAEELLSERVDYHNHEQDALLEISNILASSLELQPSLILEQLREIIEFTFGGLFAIEDSTLVALGMFGTPQLEQSSPFRIHLRGPEIMAELFSNYRPIRIADVWSDDPQAQFLRSLLDDGAAVLLEGMQSWMWVPLVVQNRVIGCMGVAKESPNHFTVHHANLALSVANQAAITMVNAELYGQAKALAALEERQRLARNLHDAVNQSLFSAGLIAEVLPRLWDRDQDLVRQSLEDVRRLTRGAQSEMRALLAELRPSTLTDTDIGDLLRLLGNALSGRSNIPVEVNVDGEYVLPAEVQLTFYRVCQEALNNIAKHADASRVEIHLKQEEEMIELRIRDDGQGFDPGQVLAGQYGLKMMGERSEAVGAEFSLTSEPGNGAEVTLRWILSGPKEVL